MKKLQPHQKRFLKTVIIVVIIFLLPYIYFQPAYAQLKESEITIAGTYYSNTRRSFGSFITTPDGTVFKIGGDISSRADFEGTLIPDTKAQIKYYRGILVCIPMNFVEELTANGKTIITYNNQQGLVQSICGIVGSLLFIAGFLFYADRAHLLKKLQNRYRKNKKSDKAKK